MKPIVYMVFWVIASICVCAVYVRAAPSAPARWHRALDLPVSLDDVPAGTVIMGRNFAWARVLPDTTNLAAVDAAMLALPRTQTLEGDVQSGRITWITRSRLFGFPDYTTAQITPQGIALFARARFGLGDKGVNAARLRAVLANLS